MKQEMIDLLKKKNKISDKDADEVLELEESEIIDFLKELGSQESSENTARKIQENFLPARHPVQDPNRFRIHQSAKACFHRLHE